jgi:5-methylcytosine-specific restriction endonuclease McrA
VDKEMMSSKGNKDKAVAKSISRWGDADSEDRGRHLRSQRIAEARSKGTHTSAEWGAMKIYHGMTCARCGELCEPVKDHIKPIYQGGSDSIENLQPLCKKCNSSKGPEAIDHRKEGWENACKNASTEGILMPENASPLPLPLPITSKTRSKTESALATRLPADWEPNDIEVQFCKTERKDLHVETVAARFRDYWIAQPGLKGRKTDWTATWRNWVRNEKSAQARASPQGYESAKDRSRRETNEALTGKRHHEQREIIDIN